MEQLARTAQGQLEDILTFFGVNPAVEVETDTESIRLKVQTDDGGRLIGHRGETLAALQHIMNMLVRQQTRERVFVHVDVGGYKQARVERLVARALELADEVAASGQESELPFMNAAERRQVHMALAERSDILTESRGEGRERRLVIKRA